MQMYFPEYIEKLKNYCKTDQVFSDNNVQYTGCPKKKGEMEIE